jgi:hypothetical protein
MRKYDRIIMSARQMGHSRRNAYQLAALLVESWPLLASLPRKPAHLRLTDIAFAVALTLETITEA